MPPPAVDPDEFRTLLETWRNVAGASSGMHYDAQRRFSKRSTRLGAIATLLTALVGATVVKEISGPSADPNVRWAVGILGALAGLVTALHTYLAYGTRAVNHRSTAAGYASVLRRIDEALVFGYKGTDDAQATSLTIRESLDALSRDAPEVPPDILDRYRKSGSGDWSFSGAAAEE